MAGPERVMAVGEPHRLTQRGNNGKRALAGEAFVTRLEATFGRRLATHRPSQRDPSSRGSPKVVACP